MLTLSGAGQGQNGSSVDDRFIITVKTDNTGTSASNQFTIPWIGTYDIDWGDGNVNTGVTDAQTHTYTTAGTYDVAVTADTGRILFNNGGDRLKLLDIKNWGTCAWTSMSSSFRGCTSLTSVTATDFPNLNTATDLTNMFWGCRLSNADFSNWDVSNVITLQLMFSADGANGTINLSNWDVSNVTNMYAMFYDCINLVPIGVENWNTQSLLNVQQMFRNTHLFNQSLANWDINQVTNFTGFMNFAGISTPNYDATLISWASQTPLTNRSVSFGSSQYSYEGRAARQSLIDNFGWTIVDGGEAVRDEFVITVKTDNAGTSADNQFTIPTSTSGITQAILYDIETSDGQTITGVAGNTTITFPSAGEYDIKISGSFPYIYFNNSGDKAKLLDIKNFGIYALGSTSQLSAFHGCSNMVISATDSGNFGSVTDFFRSWNSCSSLTSFPLIDTSSGINFTGTWASCTSLTTFPLIDTSSCTVFNQTWSNCSSLTSFPLLDTSSFTRFDFAWRNCSSLTSFPLIDTSNVTNFEYAWSACSSLTSFPLIDTSSGTLFREAWRNCSSLTSFPLIDTSSSASLYRSWSGCNSLTSFPLLNTSSVTFFREAWVACSSLTSFPLIDTSSGTNFQASWQNCSSLATFPANAFDTNIATIYSSAFLSTNLTTQSIDDILVSLDTSGVSNGTFTQSGGQAPSATGETAIDSLVGKGWTITVTGGYTPPQLLLDEYPNAAAAYSLRELSNASVGSAVVRVRRSSDNAEQDFTATEITDGTLTTFTGANDGFVATWYDQSGNSNNAVQATANIQPKIVSNGVIIVKNSKPSIDFLNVTTKLTAGVISGLDSGNSFSILSLSSNNQTGNIGAILCSSITSGNRLVMFNDTRATPNRNSILQTDSANFNFNLSQPRTSTYQVLLSLFSNGTSASCFDNTNAGTQNLPYTGSYDNNTLSIGVQFQNNDPLNGHIQEIIIYPTDQSTNRTGIENNLNTEYTIYGDVAVSGLLFDYPNASAAYSLRQLTFYQNGYAPALIRVRRSSDNAEQNFTATEITDGTLTTFTGANDGFVTTWYDQSGNNNDAVQATANLQPKIVDSVNGLILVNSKPAINSVGSKNMQILNTDIANNIDYFSAFSTLKKDTVGFRGYYLGISTGTDIGYSRVWLGTDVSGNTEQIRGRRLDSEGISEVSRGFVSTDQELITSIIRYSLGTAEIYTNGTSNNSGNYGSAGFTSPTDSLAVRLFSSSSSASFYNNNVQEIIIYTTDQDINKTSIEENINNHYNIYS